VKRKHLEAMCVDPKRLRGSEIELGTISILEEAYALYSKHIGFVRRLRNAGVPVSFDLSDWKEGFRDALALGEYKNLQYALDHCCIDEEEFERLMKHCPRLRKEAVEPSEWNWMPMPLAQQHVGINFYG
jgi:hypothetical protein